MNAVKRIIDLGTSGKTNSAYNRHIRFANSTSLIVCFFILQNAVLAIYFNQPFLILVYLVHFLTFAMVPVFNHWGKRVLAAAWFSSCGILFVSFYAIVFTLDSYNFVFLAMLIFLQFFLFSVSEIKFLFIFIVIAALCFVGAVLWQELHVQSLLYVPKGLLDAQRINSLVGILLLSIAFGGYAFSTIHKAEHEAAREKEKTELLLLNILPQAVAERFKNDQTFLAEGYQSVTVLFADIVGFTNLSEKLAPNDLVKFLNVVFSSFDELTETYGLEKIKTIGDAYLVAGGVPTPSHDHTRKICQLALQMKDVIKDIKAPLGEPLRIRIGIHTGPVTAGVIGIKKFIYDLWGDTVNTASRMESHSEEGAIQITREVYELVRDEFECKARGTIYVKGKGEMLTYFLTGVRI